VPLSATLGLVRGLRRTVEKLSRRSERTTWVDYEAHLPYAAEARAEKERFVERSVEIARPRLLWDLGCNQGLYSMIAARHADHVVAMDFDEAAVGALYEKVRGTQSNILPLVMDLMNPDPDQGWAQAERRGLAARGPADFTLSLALIHHLVISGNVPMARFTAWLADVSRAGVVEFVPKGDPMVQRLLSTRKDVHPDYTDGAFQAALEQHFRIDERHELPGSQRILYRFSAA
jgi:ribosomal protein L11 methylase PrmA